MPNYSSNKRYGGRPGRSNNNRFRGGSRGSSAPRRGKTEYINPTRFIKAAKTVEIEQYTPKNSFSDFDVNETIKSNLANSKYITPTPIQDQAIPYGILGHDIVGVANTGTGKTAAFGIPIMHNLMQFSDGYAIIMAPTRELAQQIEQELKKMGAKTGLLGALLIGGMPMGPQLRQLRDRPNIIIGTPGRIKDHIERGSLPIEKFNMVVLDEVDRMLDMGFLPDMKFILEKLAPERQSYFFSATLDTRIKDLISKFAPKHVTVSVKTGITTDNVEQDIVKYFGKAKIESLHDVLISNEEIKVIIFDETKRNVDKLTKELITRGFKASAIHGGKTQGQRKKALDSFKQNKANILVATDVAARGIDVPDISHVINYSIPQTYDDYVHRIGRTGRAGKTGKALTFIER